MPLAMMTNAVPLFSIITITLNNLSGLKKTQASITKQSCANYEWIVIDGGSTDGSSEYLKKTNANWISEPDNGLYDAMNKGITRTSGNYLIFMNAGDCFASEHTLQIIQEAIGNTRPDFIYGDAYENLNDALIYKRSRHHHKIRQGMITHHQAMLYSRGSIKAESYSLRYPIAADYDLTLRVLERAKDVLYIEEALCLFESGGISQENAFQGRKEQWLIRQAFGLSIFQNSLTFMAQTILYSIRKLCPKLYWFLKRS